MDYNRQYFLKQFDKPEEKLLFAKVFDQACLCDKYFYKTFTDFLDPYRANKYLQLLSNKAFSSLNSIIFGGNPDSERVIIGFSPNFEQLDNKDFPIDLLQVTYNPKFSGVISHRDVLGSIIGIGVSRAKIGDIIIKENDIFFYSDKSISEYLVTNLDKVSRTKVIVKKVKESEVGLFKNDLKELIITVASLRVDIIISNVFKISRSRVNDYINKEKVFINWQLIKSSSKSIEEGDIITVRGKGRIEINNFVRKTKKDKFVISILI